MNRLERLSFSIEKPLSNAFGRMVREHGYANRSEFFTDMIRREIVRKEWKEDRVCFGTVTILYNHRKRALSDKLIDLQHDHFHSILAATHVHLDHDLCAVGDWGTLDRTDKRFAHSGRANGSEQPNFDSSVNSRKCSASANLPSQFPGLPGSAIICFYQAAARVMAFCSIV